MRAHEQAHAAVGGPYAGHPHYNFTQGPNGVRYATSGHVKIDISPVAGDPAATVRKMDVVRRAALAPANPSPQDRAVAAKATQEGVRARAELARTESVDPLLGKGLGSASGAEPGAEQDANASVTPAGPARVAEDPLVREAGNQTKGGLLDLIA